MNGNLKEEELNNVSGGKSCPPFRIVYVCQNSKGEEEIVKSNVINCSLAFVMEVDRMKHYLTQHSYKIISESQELV